jgi:hypothetical protein
MKGEEQEEQMEDRVPAGQRNFVGLGKMFFNKRDGVWNIPHLHFLVDKTDSEYFEAINLEFGLVSTGMDPAEAIEALATQTHLYIMAVMEKEGDYDQFIDAVNTYTMDEFWKQYRFIEFSLAREGNDLSHNVDKQIERAVKSIMSEKMERALDEFVKNQAENLIAEVKRVIHLNEVFDFQYTTIEKAA